MDKWMDTALSPEERAGLLLKEMSLDEKMKQVVGMWSFPQVYGMDQIFENGMGSFSTLDYRNMRDKQECAASQRKFQEKTIANSPHRIPATFHMEGLCGAFIQGSTSFPAGVNRGATFDPELAEKIGQTVADQELACGITHILAPVLDVARDPRLGRVGEPYGEDPTLNGAMGAAYCRGLQSREVDGRHADAVAKHFLGFHLGQGGIHGAHAEVSMQTLREVYAKPFQAAITEGGLKGVMPCYCDMQGTPVHMSRKLLTKLLREEMGFDGTVVSDYGGVENSHKVQKTHETMGETGAAALRAGVDMEWPSPSGYGEELKKLYESGEADIADLDRAVLRVLTAKFRMGLFEHPFALEGEALEKVYACTEGSESSRKSAQESIILLKNDGTLPLENRKLRIAVIGCHAVNARSFFGGYTHLSMAEGALAARHSMAGTVDQDVKDAGYRKVPGTQVQSDESDEFNEVLCWQKPDCKNLLETLKAALPEAEVIWAYGYPVYGEDESHYNEALANAADADLILMTLGGKHGTSSIATMGEGVDATDIGLPACQEKLITRLAELGKPMVGVHLDGRPIASDIADEKLNAIVEAFSPSEFGAEAIVNVLTGAYNPSGHLPVSVAFNAGQIPVFYSHMNGSCWHQGMSIGFPEYVDRPHTPRYPFGYGLSYTSFEYSNLKLSVESVGPEQEILISFELKNTGSRTGTAVPQLYLRDRYATVIRPERELAGFARVELQPGESKTVTFAVQPSQTAFPDDDGVWHIEKGDFDVLIGSSSAETALESSFRVTETGQIDPRHRAFRAACRTE